MRSARSLFRLGGAVAIMTVAACSPDAPTASAPTPEMAAARASIPPQAQARLEQVFNRVTPEVLALPGAVFTDNDESIGRVVVGVENENARNGVRQAMSRLGIASNDYEIVVTSPIRQMVTLRDKFNPTRAGIQVHYSQYVCSMGFNIDGGTKGSQSYGRSFIINSHCTRTQGGTEGTTYYQPTSSTSGVIATEADDPAYFKGGICPKGKKCRYSDASRALYASSTASNRGEIARTTGFNNLSLTVDNANPFFTITGQANGAPVGATVNKVGRTTGWTRGTVTRTCVHTGVQGSQVVQLCQTFVENPNAQIVGGGDSGSSVWMESGGGVTLVGLLWGGSSDNRTFIFSPLNQIQQELGNFSAVK